MCAVCVCGWVGTSLHKVGTNFFAEWCYSVKFWEWVLGLGMKTVIERRISSVGAKTFCVHFSLSCFWSSLTLLSVRREGGKWKVRDGRTQCCGRIQWADISFQRACSHLWRNRTRSAARKNGIPESMVTQNHTLTLAVTLTAHLTCSYLFLFVGSRGLMRRQTSSFVDLSLDIAVVLFRGFQKNQYSNWRCLELVWWRNPQEGIVGNVCKTRVKTGRYIMFICLMLAQPFIHHITSLSVYLGSCKRQMIQCTARWRQHKKSLPR
jgi:hypothetical protein